MILLIWDSFGEEQLKLYEFTLETEINLVKRCNGHFVNEVHGLGIVDTLYELISNRTPLDPDSGPFGPYTAIYYSGFIP